MGNGCISDGLTMKFSRSGKEVWAFLQVDEGGANYEMTVSERSSRFFDKIC